MTRRCVPTLSVAVLALALLPRMTAAAAPVATPTPVYEKRVEVTATRISEDPDRIPASLTVAKSARLPMPMRTTTPSRP